MHAFQHAIKGVAYAWTDEFHFRFHTLAALVAVVLGLVYRIKGWEWFVIVICIGTVMALECVNAAIEKLCDHLHPEIHPSIKKVKDMAAAGVLIASITALTCGIMLFLPHFTQ